MAGSQSPLTGRAVNQEGDIGGKCGDEGSASRSTRKSRPRIPLSESAPCAEAHPSPQMLPMDTRNQVPCARCARFRFRP